MGVKTETGFTIIEVMLFLGVTGLLVIGVLVGSGVAIGQQRYRDSVNSLKSYLQQQYSEVANVINGRPGTWACDTGAGVSDSETGGGQARGTSDCVILGRYVTIDETGTKLTASNVTGYRTPGAADANSDITELTTNYKLGVSPIDQDVAEVSWGAQVVKPKTTSPMPFSILIIRSPLSGSTLTFSQEGIPTNVSSLITSGNMSANRDLCVNADAGTFVGKRMEVQIAPYSASQSGIQVPLESASVCD